MNDINDIKERWGMKEDWGKRQISEGRNAMRNEGKNDERDGISEGKLRKPHPGQIGFVLLSSTSFNQHQHHSKG